MKPSMVAFALLITWGTHFAQATLLTYDFTAAGNWFNSGTPPFGLSSNPTITGTLTVDNTLNDLAAFDAILVTTGTMTWDQTMLKDSRPNIGPGANVTSYDALGNLINFSFLLGAYFAIS